MIDNGFVYAVNVYAAKQRASEKKKSSNMDKLYKILREKNLTLVESKKSDFNKTQLKLIEKVGLLHYLK